MKKKPPEHENLERWMVSYADFMTLLFALFVVLYSFAMAKQSEAKSMVESIAQAFNETSQINSPGGVLLVPGSLAQKLSEEVQEAVQAQMDASEGDSGKQIIENGGMMMNFQTTSTQSQQNHDDTTSGSDDQQDGQNNSDSAMTAGELVISDNDTVSKNENPKSSAPDGGAHSGEGGFQSGGSSDHFEKGGQTDVDADSQGEGKSGTHFDAVRRSISEAISDTGMEKFIDIEEDPHWLSININSGLLFAEGSASVLAPSRPVIARIAVAISNINNYIRIRGYTDNTFIPNGIFKNSWDLSANRSLSVLNELERAGIIPERMAIEAYGEYSPKYSNATDAGRARNRKVVIAISRYAMDVKTPENLKATDAANGNGSSKSHSVAGSGNVEVVRGEGNSIELNFGK